MKITTSPGTMNIDDNAKPSIDDMNDIISSLTPNDDNGAMFQRLCNASVNFPSGTNAQFLSACQNWIKENA